MRDIEFRGTGLIVLVVYRVVCEETRDNEYFVVEQGSGLSILIGNAMTRIVDTRRETECKEDGNCLERNKFYKCSM